MKVKDYKDLDVWNKGIEITDLVYELTDKFPNTENYGLVSQIRRSAVSISANIAEGFMRNYTKEYKQFLRISLGSCAELETLLIISSRRKYISEEERINVNDKLDHEKRMLTNLIKKLSF